MLTSHVEMCTKCVGNVGWRTMVEGGRKGGEVEYERRESERKGGKGK